MKGVIPKCLQEMVESKFGKASWQNILEKSGLPANHIFFSNQEIDDNMVLKVVSNACEVLNITLEQAADAFGNYWMTAYAPKKYFAFVLSHDNAKSFLMSMSAVHKQVTHDENANPPKFEIEELADNKISMSYISKRNLEVFWIGLIKGVGDYFKEKIDIVKKGPSKVELTFSKK